MKLVWNGTEQEGRDLVNAIRRNCVCQYDGRVIRASCEAHKLFVTDQKFLDGLLFARRIVDKLLNEEWLKDGILITDPSVVI